MYFHLESKNKKAYEPFIELQTPLQFSNDYEIAVIEIAMRNSFINIPRDRSIQFVVQNRARTPVYQLPLQHYASVAEVNESLRRITAEAELGKPIIEIATVKQTETKWTLSPGVKVRFSDELQHWLGLDNINLSAANAQEKVTFSVEPDIMRGFRRIFIQTEAVRPNQYYRKTLLPILASFPPMPYDSESADLIVHKFHNPTYQRINSCTLDKIVLQFCDEEGRLLVHNSEAYSWALVHLRPCSQC